MKKKEEEGEHGWRRRIHFYEVIFLLLSLSLSLFLSAECVRTSPSSSPSFSVRTHAPASKCVRPPLRFLFRECKQGRVGWAMGGNASR